MKSKLSILHFLLMLIVTNTIQAQYYDIGQEPASTRWMKIDTGNFRFIFPDYLSDKAKETAIYFTSKESEVSGGLYVKPRKTPVILHPHSSISNAYAIWAPRRIELLMTPPQDLYAQPWLHQLALHEYRHIAQMSKTNQGLTQILGFIFGQQIHAAVIGAFVPSWYLEGDAVVAETALSRAGRGRVPAFNTPFRAILAEKGTYSYPKASLGSYKNYVPDIYTTGYHIIAASRMYYGNKPWNEAMNYSGREPILITPFNYGLKSVTNLKKKGIYFQSMAYLDSLWQGKQTADEASRISPRKLRSYTNYHSPHNINDSVIVALKTTLHDIPRIVRVSTDGKEKILHTPGYIFNNRISYNNGVMVWSEYRPHIRWENVGYTELVYCDALTGETVRKSFKSRLYAPSLSADASKTVAIESDNVGKQHIAVIQGDSIRRYALPDSLSPAYPCWSDDMSMITFIGVSESGKAVLLLDTETGILREALPYAYSEISEPYFSDRDIVFTASVGGKSQICRLDVDTGDADVLTSAAYGAFSPSTKGDMLTYLEYSANGSRIAYRKINQTKGAIYQSDTDESWPLAATLSKQDGYVHKPLNMNASVPEPKKYSKLAHLFHIHSWAPLYIDTDTEAIQPGVSIMSQNLLSTLFVTAGYNYNRNENSGMFRSEIIWKGWFPEFSASISHGLRALKLYQDLEYIGTQTWTETTFDVAAAQTLDFSRGAYSKGLYAKISKNYIKTGNFTFEPENQIEGIFSSLSYRLFNYAYKRQAHRDIAPRLGYNIGFRYRHTPFGGIEAGSIFAAQSQLFLPGIFANHSLSFYAAYQQASFIKYRFTDEIILSRGYEHIPTNEETTSLKANYRFPIAYPDFNIGGLLYLKRLRGGFFYDVTRVEDRQDFYYFNSAGFDLTYDYHLFGLSTPVTTTLRSVYLFNDNEFVFNVLFSINFYDF